MWSSRMFDVVSRMFDGSSRMFDVVSRMFDDVKSHVPTCASSCSPVLGLTTNLLLRESYLA